MLDASTAVDWGERARAKEMKFEAGVGRSGQVWSVVWSAVCSACAGASAGWRKEGELRWMFGWCRLLGLRLEGAAARGRRRRGGWRAGQQGSRADALAAMICSVEECCGPVVGFLGCCRGYWMGAGRAGPVSVLEGATVLPDAIGQESIRPPIA